MTDSSRDIAILGPGDGTQVEAVVEALEARGVSPTVWDSGAWPGGSTSLSIHQADDGPRIAFDGHDCEVGAVYTRRYGLNPTAPEHRETLQQRPYSFLNQVREYKGLAESALLLLEDRGVRIVNSPGLPAIHRVKPWQLGVLSDAGLPVPETLSTNDPEAVRAFAERVDEVVYKPVSGGALARTLEPVDPEEERLKRIANSPVQFQERLDGENLRIFVVGGEVAAAFRIVSDALDYRSESHDVEPVELAPSIEEAALRAANCLGLAFTGVDVVDEGEDFALLEANPSPMFAGFDVRGGTDVGGRLAEMLIRSR